MLRSSKWMTGARMQSGATLHAASSPIQTSPAVSWSLLRVPARYAAFEVACLAIYAFLLWWQLFVPPFLGMANNGDFCKVLGRLSMGPERPVKNRYQVNRDYFVSGYTTAPEWKMDAGLFSSAIPMVWITREIAGLMKQTPHYDIRYFGALNASLLLITFVLALLYLRTQPPLTRYLIPPLLIAIFADATYVSQLNSFYMDTAALVFLLATVASACLLARAPGSLPWTFAFIGTSVLLVTSKAQHAMLALPAAALSSWFAYRAHDRLGRTILAGAAVLLPAVMLFMLRVPAHYRANASYCLVFFKLAKIAPDPVRALTDLGLSAAETRRINAFTFDAPANFGIQVPYGVVVSYLISHPALLLKSFETDLVENTHPIKANYANYRQEDGFAPWTEARHLRFWSRRRGELNQLFPFNLVLLYVVPLILLCFRPFRRQQLAPVAGFLLVSGCLEFTLVSIGGGIDPIRQLSVFHAITELIIVFSAARILNGLQPGMTALLHRQA